ncbi:MAG: cation transporting ATPase C-terminal domain-containing protein, partial [Candidatus Kapaibacterium sp.]
PEEDDIMQRSPRKPDERLLPWRRIDLSLLQGSVSLAITFGLYVYILHIGRGELEARTLSFATLIFSNLGLILTNRSWSTSLMRSFKKKNGALISVLGGTIVLLAIVLYLPTFQALFHFDTLHADDIILCFIGGAVSILWFEIFKKIHKKVRVSY